MRYLFFILSFVCLSGFSQTLKLNDGTVTINSTGALTSDNTSLAWNDTVYFNKTYRAYAEDTVTGNIVVKIKSTGKIQGTTEMIVFVGDGSHTVDFTACRQASGSFNYDATANALNFVTFIYDGTRVWYSIMK